MSNVVESHFSRTLDEGNDLDGIDPGVYGRRWVILAAVCVALLGVMLANSSIGIALPQMSVDLNITQLTLTWIVNIYSLLFASLLFLAGAFGDKYGRKLALQVGSAIFAVSAFYGGFLAKSGADLIVARAVMGFGGALVMPTTLSIINNVFPKNQRARAIAIWSGVSGAGMLLGSVVSGAILEHSTWRSLFYLSAAIAGAGLVVNQFVVPESRDEHGAAVDWLGGALVAVGVFGVVYAITQAPSDGLSDRYVLIGLIGGLVTIAAFVRWQLRVPSPLLDMNLFKNRAFAVSSLTLTLAFFAMSGLFFTISQLQQIILGMTPLTASISIIPLMIPMIVMAPLIPNIVKKIGARFTMSIGLFLVAIAFLIMSTWQADVTYWSLLQATTVLLIGISATMAPGTTILMASVPRNRSGMGSATNDITRELGASLGIAVLGSVLSSVYASRIAEVAGGVPEPLRVALETSLPAALHVLGSFGAEAAALAESAKNAWMDALSAASRVEAGIMFVAALIALVALPKHTEPQSDTI